MDEVKCVACGRTLGLYDLIVRGESGDYCEKCFYESDEYKNMSSVKKERFLKRMMKNVTVED